MIQLIVFMMMLRVQISPLAYFFALENEKIKIIKAMGIFFPRDNVIKKWEDKNDSMEGGEQNLVSVSSARCGSSGRSHSGVRRKTYCSPVNFLHRILEQIKQVEFLSLRFIVVYIFSETRSFEAWFVNYGIRELSD